MRGASAILFLLIILFNLVGYRLVISSLQTSSEILFEKQVDKQEYNDEELISVKTKLNIPYYTSSPTYERTYGSVNIGGQEYEYVKRRVYRDTLELLCLPNRAKTQLLVAENEFAKLSAEAQASLPVKKTNSALKISLPDFFQLQKAFSLSKIESSKNVYASMNLYFHFSKYVKQPDRPPQSLCS